jgi:hypothetical protein
MDVWSRCSVALLLLDHTGQIPAMTTYIYIAVAPKPLKRPGWGEVSFLLTSPYHGCPRNALVEVV